MPPVPQFNPVLYDHYLLIREPHLPPYVSRDILATQEDPPVPLTPPPFQQACPMYIDRYLLIAEPHLPPRVSRDIHAAQEDPLLVTVVEDGGAGVLGLKAPHQLGLD